MKFSSQNSLFSNSSQFKSYMRTDLACESINTSSHSPGTHYKDYVHCSVPISELIIENEEGEKAAGRKIGRYATIHSGYLYLMDEDKKFALTEAISFLISSFAERLCKCSISKETKVLIAGLGNRFITADSIGPRTADKIVVTAHITEERARCIFDELGTARICAIHPGVMGQTGIEAVAMIKGACDHFRPDVVIAVDALSARSTKRLCATIQLSDAGIEPGSGIGNRRGAVNSKTLGFPVIAIGVPTVVDSATLISDALMKAGVTEFDNRLTSVLSEEANFFVSPRDSDSLCEDISSLLAGAINRAFFAEGL